MNVDSKAEDFGSMSLPELFAASDRIGDKYLTEAELQQRDRELAEALSELDKTSVHQRAICRVKDVVLTQKNGLQRPPHIGLKKSPNMKHTRSLEQQN